MYQAHIAASTSITAQADLQSLIIYVDESETAFDTVQAAAISGNADSVTANLLGQILDLTVIDANIADYQDHIEAQASIDSIISLQGVIDAVDDSLTAFATVQDAAINNIGSDVDDDVLSNILSLTHTASN